MFLWRVVSPSGSKVDFMGGAKKKSLAQMDKSQQIDAKKVEPPKKTKAKALMEKKLRGITGPNVDDNRFLTELSKMGAITPYALASQFNLRISVAKDLLEELEKKRLVQPVGGNARLRIYQAVAS
jgi:ribosomal protein S25